MKEAENVFVDVDDTLIRSFGSKRIPNPGVIEKVGWLKTNGYSIYVWSSAGAEYAKRISSEVGISAFVDGYFSKPKYIIDDQPVENWINTKVVHPLQIDSIK